MKNKALVFGGFGQLGQCIFKVAKFRKTLDLLFLDSLNGNVLDCEQINSLFVEYQPQYVINCSAYTSVDNAEDKLELARLINGVAVENIANACKKYNVILIHISTDFVFEGNTPNLLNETDGTNPINNYGLTKLEGELAISKILTNYYILRTSWLYSEFSNNFLKTMLKLGKERDELGIIADQVGTPTYAVDLAGVILEIIEKKIDKFGLYHYSNEGVASWYDFAKAIFTLASYDVNIKPIKSCEFKSKAMRPKFSVLDKTKIKNNLSIQIPYWKDSLALCLNEFPKNRVNF
jgi:dTDP-4-dehydrorhamnose reductase